MHNHSHDSSSNRISIAFFLNVGFTIIEFIGGVLTNSTAIMADAVHDLGDSLSIGSAWILDKLSKKDADEVFTYGYRRLSLFSAMINGLVLVGGSIWILTQALPRLFNPVLPVTEGMILLAVFGISVNGYAAFKLSAGKSLNEKVLNWHLLEDVIGWVAVLIVSIILQFFEWPILDPILAILFTLFILFNVVKNLKTTLKVFFQAAPEVDLVKKIHNDLTELDLIKEIHHEHCWSLDGEHNVYTVHLLLSKALSQNDQLELKTEIARKLERYQLAHTTIELEFPDETCRDSDY
jgi:cobalt-zinc-cadmium efflux system protein